MESLELLLEGIDYEVIRGTVEGNSVSTVVYDTRKLKKDCLFVCIRGANFDGHEFAAEAVKAGAKVLVTERDVLVPNEGDVTVIRVEDTRYALAFIAAEHFGRPASSLTTIGVTGTKGKTTTTYLIKHILEKAGHKVGLVGTIETIINDEHIPSKNTTPESFLLQQYFREMADAGIDTVVMEVSSQALKLHRTQGFIFDYGVFTNISPDHIGDNEHKDFEEYMECKSRLFRQCITGIVNGDDGHLNDILKGHTCNVETFGFNTDNDLRAEDVKLVNGGNYLGVNFDVKGLMNFNTDADFPGRFSVYNALCAIAVCRHFNVSEDDIRSALKTARVKGRIEMIHVSDEYTLMIDYAHNAMALESLLRTLREYEPGRIVCLFGCGGNRAKARRFEMGEVSGKLSDFTIITSDNPRFEEPQTIMDDIETGIKKTSGRYIEITDRKEAIAYAINHAKKGDVIVLAGKGHEDYQEIKGMKYPMDERDIIKGIVG